MVEEFCDIVELDWLWGFLDKQFIYLQGVVVWFVNCLQCKFMVQQNWVWDFDLEEGFLDMVWLICVVIDFMLLLVFKQECDINF